MKFEPPQDHGLPQLRDVLRAAGLTRRLQHALQATEPGSEIARAHVRRLYYEPGSPCRLLVEARLRVPGAPERTQLYFGEMFETNEFERAVRQLPERPAAVVHRDALILWAFPGDPYLAGTASLANPPAMHARIQANPGHFGLPGDATIVDVRVELSKYVPARRCSFAYAVRWRDHAGVTSEHRFFGKTYLKGRAGPACEILQRIGSSSACRTGRLRIPRVYGYDVSLEAVWQELVPGTPQSKNAHPADLLESAGQVGAALAALHTSDVAFGPGKGMSKQTQDLERAAARIVAAYPSLAPQCAEVAHRLLDCAPRLPGAVVAPVHGSFKSGHVLVDDGRVAIIDFDGAGLGDPLYDVGRYLARLDLAGAKSAAARSAIDAAAARFREFYAAAVPWGWPEMRVRWYTSAHLVASQAQKNVKRMAPRRVRSTLQRAEKWFPAELMVR